MAISIAWIKLLFYNQLPIEFSLVECGTPWMIDQPMARLLTGLFVGLWVVSLFFKRNGFIWAVVGWIGMAVFTYTIYHQVSHAHFADKWIFPLYKPLLLRCLFMGVALLSWWVARSFIQQIDFFQKQRSTIIIVGSLLSFLVLFWLRPIYIADFQEINEPVPTDVSQQLKRVVGKTDLNKPVYLFYFSLGCEHCYMMYHRLATEVSLRKPNYQARIIFSEPKEGLKDFLGNTHIPFPATQVLGKQFYMESGPQVPAIYRFERGRCTGYWLGDGFNFYMLNQLSDL